MERHTRTTTTRIRGLMVVFLGLGGFATASAVSGGSVAAAAADTPQLPCKALSIDNHQFDLSALAGPHTVVTSEFAPPSYYNRTYTLDLCGTLERKGEAEGRFKCPKGTSVCQIKHHWNPEDKKSTVEEVIPIAGDLAEHGGGKFTWEATRLKTAENEGGKEGLKVTLKGGVWETREQRAVVELRCNKTMEGKEGEWESEDEYVRPAAKRDDADKSKAENGVGEPEHQLKKDGAALIWDGYKREGEVDTLYLTWYTKYACESAAGEPPVEDRGGHWGWFTWMVILVFLAIATYLIFGSWLNYNRYGARGWDLLPHGDTLRDVPYLLKDWTRRVLNTVQSSGSRGGYSAV
ncbi:autophagy-related protein 27 [Echria macrotheca]|uniref:Autophagy-related protein 27 n=1 Tax=Echria macrotheca TaxID=438768 RepID=A0AAJ0FFD3_9PEZI|nr:autophagy-related protein 27 [Echria macrotheca]